jgi:hypothetical protein
MLATIIGSGQVMRSVRGNTQFQNHQLRGARRHSVLLASAPTPTIRPWVPAFNRLSMVYRG